MNYIEFDAFRPLDLILLGRVAIDFNPAYNDQVKKEFKPLKDVHMFEKFVGGSLGFKIGSGLSVALITLLLENSGFQSSVSGGVSQCDEALKMIADIYQYGILIIWIVAVIVLLFYKLDKIYPTIMKDLEQREKEGIL